MVDRVILLATLSYLGGRDMNNFTKPAVISALIERIDHHLPHDCNLCQSSYVIEQEEQPLLNCNKCGRGVHTACFLKYIEHPAAADNTITPSTAEVMDMINPYKIQGWVYLCPCCHKKLIPSPEEGMYKRIAANTENQNSAQPEISPDANTETSNAGVSNNEGIIHETPTVDDDSAAIDLTADDDDDMPPVLDELAPVLSHFETGYRPNPGPITSNSQTSSPQSSLETQQDHVDKRHTSEAPICRFYSKNICKHGISGKGIPGEQCKFSHPKRCAKFTTHGTFRGGCKKGNQCKDFHPLMCRDSLKAKKCTNMQCKFTHIKGTQRYERYEPTKRYEPAYQSTDEQAQRYQQPTHPVNTAHGQQGNYDQEHFLDVLNNLKQELFQMMEQKLARHVPPHQILMPQLPPQQQNQMHHPQPMPQQNQMNQQFIPTYHMQNVHNSPPMVH